MITKQEIFKGIYAAWQLLLGNRDAVKLFDDSVRGFWKSFSAAVIVFPIYTLLIVIGTIDFKTTHGLFSLVLLNIEFYIIGWVLWPLIFGYIVPVLDRSEKYTLYIVVYNWANVIGATAFLITIIASEILPLGQGFGALLIGMVTLGLLAYHVFLSRVALDIPLGAAVGLTICEFVLGQMLLIVQQGVSM